MAGVGRGQEAGKVKARGWGWGIIHKGKGTGPGPGRCYFPGLGNAGSPDISIAQTSHDQCEPSRGQALSHHLSALWLESLTEPGVLSQPLGLQKGRLRPRTRTRSGPGSDPESPCLGPLQKSALIKLANIRAAEKVEEKSFGSSHVMQVIYEDDAGKPQTVYLQCKVGAVWWALEGRAAGGRAPWGGGGPRRRPQ